jgi:hypothetical protein
MKKQPLKIVPGDVIIKLMQRYGRKLTCEEIVKELSGTGYIDLIKQLEEEKKAA